jgi:biopolymer transport protein ExbB/TolQ
MDFALSPLALFHQAGPVGKTVMLALIALSVWSWVAAIDVLIALRASARQALRWRDGAEPAPPQVTDAARLDIAHESGGERRARVAEAIVTEGAPPLRRAARALSSLSVVASVSPFVGLFGTVWGVMTSFAGIAQTQETSLAVVAPGVAEALAATAYGLAAAIPAAIFYAKLNAALSEAEARGAETAARAAAWLCARHGHVPEETRHAA